MKNTIIFSNTFGISIFCNISVCCDKFMTLVWVHWKESLSNSLLSRSVIFCICSCDIHPVLNLSQGSLNVCSGICVTKHFSVSIFRDPRVTTDVVPNVEDVKDRIHNWDTLLKNIKAYYQVPIFYNDSTFKCSVVLIIMSNLLLSFCYFFITKSKAPILIKC